MWKSELCPTESLSLQPKREVVCGRLVGCLDCSLVGGGLLVVPLHFVSTNFLPPLGSSCRSDKPTTPSPAKVSPASAFSIPQCVAVEFPDEC